jgi:hypothetical protein
MLCSKDKKTKDNLECHKEIDIELNSTFVFVAIGDVRPSTIFTNKHKMSLNSFTEVIKNNDHIWRINGGILEQVTSRLLLCHFHAIKA